MDNPLNSLSLCSYNCRSFKNNVATVSDLCDRFDKVCLQEHWLLPSDLYLLNTFNRNIISCASSAMDEGMDILVGRPYGGTAILYNKALAGNIKHVFSSNSRITAVLLESNNGNI